MPSDRPNYGIDAPRVVVGLLTGGAASFVSGSLLLLNDVPQLGRMLVITGIWCCVPATVMLVSSVWGKFRLRDRMLDDIPWRGDEQVLDVGCGHGLMLIGAARRVPRGNATGVDVWSQRDQASNSREATERNARLEGVADRVEIRDADARTLPFRDATFDVVLSSFVIHNIAGAEERDRAVREIARVTKSGGYVGIADVGHVRAYRHRLETSGFILLRSRVSPLFALQTRTILMRKKGRLS